MNSMKIDFWIKNNQNVLFIGKHGVGKTAMVRDAFEHHGLKYRYFSASTMDPWVDFIGVPKEKRMSLRSDQMLLLKDLLDVGRDVAEEWIISNWKVSTKSANSIIQNVISDKNISYLELIKPEAFANGDIEAIFFDEFNRSPKKVRNAVMELMQFKSINGNKFPKLKLIWAAINPEDDSEYDIEKMDPAQKDRFHVFVSVPYRPNVEWFRDRYGEKMADAAVQWWDELEDKSFVSPRRLQYALDTYVNKGDMRDVLPLSSNVSKLSLALSNGPILEKLVDLMSKNDKEQVSKFLANENNFSSAIRYILKSSSLSEYFLPLCPKEKLSALLSQNDKSSSFILGNYHKFETFKNVIDDVLTAGSNKTLVKKIRKHLTESQFVLRDSDTESGPATVFYNKDKGCDEFKSCLKEIASLKSSWKDSDRVYLFTKIKQNISKEIHCSDVENCLSILSKIAPTSTEASNPEAVWNSLTPILNHLIVEGVQNRVYENGSLRANPISLRDFQIKNVSPLSSLCLILKLAGLENKVISNESQITSVIEGGS